MDGSRLRESFAFPVATPAARRDLVIGALLLLVPVVGWVLNLGHRLDVVHRIFHDEPPYHRGFAPWGRTLGRGLMAFTAICTYLGPSLALGACAFALRDTAALWPLAGLAACAFALAIFTLPGGMTYNAAFGDIRYLYRPDRAFRRALAGGADYLRAWGISLLAISLSFLGLAAVGIGFLATSVWAWMVVGHAFSRALALRAARPPA